VDIVWVVQHASISATYFDEAAGKFFETKLASGRLGEGDVKAEAKRRCYTIVGGSTATTSTGGGDENIASGCALGPHWLSKLEQDEEALGRASLNKFLPP